MRSPIPHLPRWTGLAAAALALVVVLPLVTGAAMSPPAPETGAAMPAYDEEGRLLLPDDYRRWVFVGSSLGLSYSEGAPGHEMFHETLMEPTAYDHFTRTGEFREGTMLVLMLHGTGEGVLPGRHGRFANEIHGIEMAVKDSSHGGSRWDYYGFGGMGGTVRDRAQAFEASSCADCHAEHAAHDNVFVQFYPLLREAAPEGTRFRASRAPREENEPAAEGERATPAADADRPQPAGEAVALGGLDPVLLTEGRRELGKPEIVESFGGRRYQFVSEPTRARFAAASRRHAIQNETCPVSAGAPVDPSLFAVYEGRLFAFASAVCVEEFERAPELYLPPASTPRESAAAGASGEASGTRR